jgi:hypothetical protein
MTYRVLLFNIALSLFSLSYTPTISTGMKLPMDFEKELEEANRAIEEYVASLSPEEQAAFNQQVEETARMFENMSEAEFEQFLGGMFGGEEQMFAPAPVAFEPVQAPQPQEEIPTVVLNAEDKKKVDTAIAIIDDIIQQSNLFMVLINSSTDLPNKITRWGNKGTISYWQQGATWASFKTELDTLIQKLSKAKDQDLTTKQYKYLLNLIADEGLYNNLIQLQTDLKRLVPTINIPEFSIQKLDPQTKATIQNILRKYTECFYTLAIPKALDALFEKYAPEAEKIRGSEESATKRAFESSKAMRSPATKTEAGIEPMPDYGYDYGYGSYGSDYGYPSYGNYDYGYSPDYGSYGSDYGYGSDNSGKSRGGNSSGGSHGGGSSGKEGKDKEESDKDKDKDKGKAEQVTPNLKIERSLAEIISDFKDIETALIDEETEKETKLAKLAETVMSPDIDIALAGSTLPTIINKKLTNIQKALETISSIATDKLNPLDLAHYQKEVQKIFDKNKKDLDLLRDNINYFGTKEEVEQEKTANAGVAPDQQKEGKKDITTLSPEQQWAFFGGNESELPTGDASDKLKEQISSPVSLFAIRDTIDKLFEDTKKFYAQKSRMPVIKKKKSEVPSADIE